MTYGRPGEDAGPSTDAQPLYTLAASQASEAVYSAGTSPALWNSSAGPSRHLRDCR